MSSSAAPALRGPAQRVEDEVRDPQQLLGPRDAGAPEQRAEPGEQLVERERLGEVVVGAGIQARDAVGDLVAGRQHEDRGAALARPQPPAHGEAVEDRHHDVEDDHVRLAQRDRLEGLRAVVHRLDVVALDAEGEDERLAHAAVVLGDEDPGARLVRCHAREPYEAYARTA